MTARWRETSSVDGSTRPGSAAIASEADGGGEDWRTPAREKHSATIRTLGERRVRERCVGRYAASRCFTSRRSRGDETTLLPCDTEFVTR